MSRVFRFAPSPNGLLHLGHAFSALLNRRLADEAGGRLLLRIEDIDAGRSTAAFEEAIYRDLAWLGISWEEPVRRQSGHLDLYHRHLDRLVEEELVYPSFMSRGEIRAFIADAARSGRPWPHDPDGVPLYPGIERGLSRRRLRRRMESGEPFAWRLDMQAALARLPGPLSWQEGGSGPEGESGLLPADPARWGDVVVARRDVPASYHLCVVVDDALQGVTDVVRGRDLFHATAIHRLLQALLGLPEPVYRHHRLILGEDGRKLSKSRGDTALAALREGGATPEEIRMKLDPGL